MDGARRQAELQEGRPRATADRELATDAHPEDRVREAEMILHGLASRRDRVTERRLGRRLGLGPRLAPDRLVNRIDAERRRPVRSREPDAQVVRMRAPRIARNVHDLVVGDLGMGHEIAGREPADAPSGGPERALVLEVQPPGVGAVELVLNPGALPYSLRAGVPERVEVSHIVGHPEPVVQRDGLERAVSRPFLQHADPEVGRVAELMDGLAARV